MLTAPSDTGSVQPNERLVGKRGDLEAMVLKKSWKVLSLGVATALFAAGCGGAGSGSGDTVKLGVAIPLSGPLAQVGASMELAARYAVDEINADGGVLDRDVELVIADTTEDPTRASQEITRLLTQEKVDFLVGPATTDTFAATVATVTDAKLPQLHGSGSVDFGPDAAPHSFSYTASVPDQAKAMVDYALSQGYHNVAIVQDNGQYGKAAGQALGEALDAAGLSVEIQREYKAGEADLTPLMLAIEKQSPDAVMLFASNGEDTGRVLKAVQDVGLSAPVIGNYGTTFVTPAKEIAGENAYENVVAVTYPGVGACSAADIPSNTVDFIEALYEFDEKVAAKSNLDFVAIIRDGLLLMGRGINGADSLDGDKVTAWLEANASQESDGLINVPIAINSATHFLTGAESMAVVRPGTELSPGIYQLANC